MRARHHPAIADLNRLLPAPVEAVEDKAARRLDGAPGVYIDRDGSVAKIAALGLRIRKNGCYHGVSLNVDMELSPFAAINPCGYAGMAVTQTRDLGLALTPAQAAEQLAKHLSSHLESA